MITPALRRVGGASLALALAIVPLAAGCSSHRPEKNPYIVEKFEQIEESLGELNKLQRDVSILQDDLKFFAQEITEIKTMKGGLTAAEREQIAAATEKLAEIQKMTERVDQLNAQLTTLDSAVPSGTSSRNYAAAPPTTPKAPVKETDGNAKAPTPPSTPNVASPKPPAEPTQSKTTTGRSRYYEVKSGESLSSIAKSQGVTVQALASANQLPPTAGLAIGQRIWIP